MLWAAVSDSLTLHALLLPSPSSRSKQASLIAPAAAHFQEVADAMRKIRPELTLEDARRQAVDVFLLIDDKDVGLASACIC